MVPNSCDNTLYYYQKLIMILITKLLLSTGGHGLSKLAVGILVLLSLSGICAVGLYIVYPLSTGNDHGTSRNDSEQTFPTSTNSKGIIIYE